MKKQLFFILFITLTACNSSKEITQPHPSGNAACNKVFAFTPAPGQFINENYTITSPAEACAYAEQQLQANGALSLGGWGGSIIVGFDHPITNDGGYNIRIGGNAFGTSSEQGIVFVMTDTNGNGLPDDQWYELAGSESEAATTLRNYAVTYFRPAAADDPIRWEDNQEQTGLIKRIATHTQNYFPAWITGESYTLHGVCIAPNVEQVNGLWVAKPYPSGYADNFGSDRFTDDGNAGGNVSYNHFRISNAITAEGVSIRLAQIDFVKVQTGVNFWAPVIGEISTEVFSIEDYNFIKQ
ncbi:MAG: hypothetical protein RR330_00585 [Alistipes sp.]